MEPGELLLTGRQSDFEQTRVRVCLLSVLISFFCVSKSDCSSDILRISCRCVYPTQCSELRQTVPLHLLRNLYTFTTLGLA